LPGDAGIIGETMRATTTFLGVGALCAGLMGACSAAAPTTTQYTLEFPSTAAAVGADTVQVFVFDHSQPKTDCTSLISGRAAKNLPPSIAQTDQVPLCDVLSGAKGKIPDVAYGSVSFLAVTQRNGVDYFTGCVSVQLSATSAPVGIQLQAATTSPIPTTNCMNVSDFCSKGCTVM
jgi:hypothetical protein